MLYRACTFRRAVKLTIQDALLLCFNSSKCTPGFILPNRIVPRSHMRGCFGHLKPEETGGGIP